MMDTFFLFVLGLALACLLYVSSAVWTMNGLVACLDVQPNINLCESVTP